MTVYNPVFLIKDLRDHGFKVVEDKPTGRLHVSKEVNGIEFEHRGFDYFLRLVQTHLFPDRMVTDIVVNTMSNIHAAGMSQPGANVLMDLDFQFMF
jgi:hypothetical protein